MQNSQYINWNLKEIIQYLTTECPSINTVYLFGSRAYRTGSFRSDIDLIVCSSAEICDLPLRDELHEKYPPVDLFVSTHPSGAKSMMNGSVINKREEFENVLQQVDAVLLWDKEAGYNSEYTYWLQTTEKNINFTMSIIPSSPSYEEIASRLLADLSNDGVDTYFAGVDIDQIAHSIVKLIETALIKPANFAKRARSFSFDTMKLSTEYDFQNLIHLILRPVFPTIEPEPFEICIDGNKKFADFALLRNRIVIEAKHLDNNTKKADVIKTLDGLTDFYSNNSNIKFLIFLILCDPKVDYDPAKLEKIYSDRYRSVPIITKFLPNPYHK